MVKRNYEVQVGRVGLINYGKDAGKYCTVLDIVDSNKVRHISFLSTLHIVAEVLVVLETWSQCGET